MIEDLYVCVCVCDFILYLTAATVGRLRAAAAAGRCPGRVPACCVCPLPSRCPATAVVRNPRFGTDRPRRRRRELRRFHRSGVAKACSTGRPLRRPYNATATLSAV